MPVVQILIAGAALAMRPQAAASAVADPAPSTERMSNIVVSARWRRKIKSVSPVDYYRRYCFDAKPQTGRSLAPNHDPGWTSLGSDSRSKFGVGDPNVPAFGLCDEARGQTRLLRSSGSNVPAI